MPQPDTLDPRILGQRIAEARKARGKTQEEVADFLGCSRPTYIAIEKGDRLAKSEEIVKLASFLGRKVNELVRPTEPVVDLQPHLRAAADKMKEADREALNAAIDELQRLAEDYRDLEKLMNAPLRFNYPPEVTLNPRIDAAELAESVAQQERQRLGLGDQPVIYLRSTLEWDVGLRIFYWNLPSPIAGMYAYTADLGCCILVNTKHPPERRRVSMLHEYGHLIVDRYKPGIDYLTMPGRKPANERFAESFALSFLMPTSSVRQRFHDIVTTTGDFHVAELRRLSHFYFVSVEAMALRLEQLGLIQKGSCAVLEGVEVFAPRGGGTAGLAAAAGERPPLPRTLQVPRRRGLRAGRDRRQRPRRLPAVRHRGGPRDRGGDPDQPGDGVHGRGKRLAARISASHCSVRPPDPTRTRHASRRH